MIDQVIKKKKEYNYWINRYNKALSFFENILVEEYKKPLEDYVHWFNDIVKRCSNLMTDIEKLTGKELTEVEKWKGFKEVM